jgi:hypothetical protein
MQRRRVYARHWGIPHTVEEAYDRIEWLMSTLEDLYDLLRDRNLTPAQRVRINDEIRDTTRALTELERLVAQYMQNRPQRRRRPRRNT